MNLILILTNQLFEKSIIFEDINDNDIVFLYEHPTHFTKYKYHKMKLVMHRATMKFYEDYIKKEYTKNIKYFEFNEDIFKEIKKIKNLEKIKVYNPIDHQIIKEYLEMKKELQIELILLDNPGNICTLENYNEYINNNKNKNVYLHHSFYIWCRKKFNILMKNNNPLGNKWSFDTENRIPFPKDYNDDIKFKIKNNEYLKEAKEYINKHFKNNQGSDDYYLPIDFKGAKTHLNNFLKNRLENFGPYEDAVSEKIIFGYHSVLSPIINIGLITPNYIINEIQKYYEKKNIKLQSIEGYIRQLFWREFCILVYLNKNYVLEKENFFNHKNKIDKSWYNGETKIFFINDIIKKALKYGWIHHIERLMYIGNFMLLNEIHPKECYKWFMEMFIDAYPWVMSPNVYGMSQHSAGPIMMKRPYFSSSNYIDKMSTYKKKINKYDKIKIKNENYEWYELWDALYYNFINNNQKYLEKNYSTANITKIWKNKELNEKKMYLEIAKKMFSY